MSMRFMSTDVESHMHHIKGLILLMIFSICGQAQALSFDQLLRPGKLIEGHSRYEDKCETCHEKLNKEQQNERCVGCHDHRNIASDIKDNKGFHGKAEIISRVLCSHCHTDHKGRDADVVLFDADSFDHTVSDFELEGKHRNTECSACHRPEDKYSQAPGGCIDCHKDNQPHKERLGKECDKCHTTKGGVIFSSIMTRILILH